MGGCLSVYDDDYDNSNYEKDNTNSSTGCLSLFTGAQRESSREVQSRRNNAQAQHRNVQAQPSSRAIRTPAAGLYPAPPPHQLPSRANGESSPAPVRDAFQSKRRRVERKTRRAKPDNSGRQSSRRSVPAAPGSDMDKALPPCPRLSALPDFSSFAVTHDLEPADAVSAEEESGPAQDAGPAQTQSREDVSRRPSVKAASALRRLSKLARSPSQSKGREGGEPPRKRALPSPSARATPASIEADVKALRSIVQGKRSDAVLNASSLSSSVIPADSQMQHHVPRIAPTMKMDIDPSLLSDIGSAFRQPLAAPGSDAVGAPRDEHDARRPQSDEDACSSRRDSDAPSSSRASMLRRSITRWFAARQLAPDPDDAAAAQTSRPDGLAVHRLEAIEGSPAASNDDATMAHTNSHTHAQTARHAKHEAKPSHAPTFSTASTASSSSSSASTFDTSRFPTAPTTPPLSRSASTRTTAGMSVSSASADEGEAVPAVPALPHLPHESCARRRGAPHRDTEFASIAPPAAWLPGFPQRGASLLHHEHDYGGNARHAQDRHDRFAPRRSSGVWFSTDAYAAHAQHGEAAMVYAAEAYAMQPSCAHLARRPEREQHPARNRSHTDRTLPAPIHIQASRDRYKGTKITSGRTYANAAPPPDDTFEARDPAAVYPAAPLKIRRRDLIRDLERSASARREREKIWGVDGLGAGPGPDECATETFGPHEGADAFPTTGEVDTDAEAREGHGEILVGLAI